MVRFLIFVLLVAPSVALAGVPTATEILAKSKTANGGNAWNHVFSMQIQAVQKVGGSSGLNKTLVDLRSGSVASQAKLGATTIASGFNGKSSWTAMSNMPGGTNESPMQQKAGVTRAYLDAYGWWYPERSPAKFGAVGKKVENGKSYWTIKITPKGGDTLTLWVNGKTYMIAREVVDFGVTKMTVFLKDYRVVHGIKVAFLRKAEVSMGGSTMTTVTRLKKVRVNVPVSAEDFAMPHKQ